MEETGSTGKEELAERMAVTGEFAATCVTSWTLPYLNSVHILQGLPVYIYSRAENLSLHRFLGCALLVHFALIEFPQSSYVQEAFRRIASRVHSYLRRGVGPRGPSLSLRAWGPVASPLSVNIDNSKCLSTNLHSCSSKNIVSAGQGDGRALGHRLDRSITSEA